MKWSSFRYLVRQGWHSMVANRLMTLASMGVLTACLFITGVAVLLSLNVNRFVDYLGTQNEIECFISDTYPDSQISELQSRLAALDNVATCEYVSKAQAVQEMQEDMGEDANLLDAYAGEGNTENPLPASFRISITDVSLLDTTVAQIQQTGADAFYRIESPGEFSDMFVSLRRTVNIVGWGLVAVLGTVSIVVISNTIKLTVFPPQGDQHHEIRGRDQRVHPLAVLCGGHDGGRAGGAAGHVRRGRRLLCAAGEFTGGHQCAGQRAGRLHGPVLYGHLADAGGLCAVRHVHRQHGLRLQHPQAPEGIKERL